MAVITNAQIVESTPVSVTNNYVRLRFTLDTGDILEDGPRVLPKATDLVVYAASVGAALLDDFASKEINQWLSA